MSGKGGKIRDVTFEERVRELEVWYEEAARVALKLVEDYEREREEGAEAYLSWIDALPTQPQ